MSSDTTSSVPLKCEKGSGEDTWRERKWKVGGGGGGCGGGEFACIMSCEQSQVNHSREGFD